MSRLKSFRNKEFEAFDIPHFFAIILQINFKITVTNWLSMFYFFKKIILIEEFVLIYLQA